MTTRRNLFKLAAAVAAGLLLPPTLAENAEATKKFWALDQTMVSDSGIIELYLGRNPRDVAILEDLRNTERIWQPAGPFMMESTDGGWSWRALNGWPDLEAANPDELRAIQDDYMTLYDLNEWVL